MNTIDAIKGRRSIRHFNSAEIEQAKVDQLKEVTRYYPCPGNLQPLKFIFLQGQEEVLPIFRLLHWAKYLPHYSLPEHSAPQALLLIFGDTSISSDFGFSAGAVATEIMLTAQELGLSCCCLGALSKEKIATTLGIDPVRFNFQCLIALGYSCQQSSIVNYENSCRYWQDDNGNFYVPKRTTEETFLTPQINKETTNGIR